MTDLPPTPQSPIDIAGLSSPLSRRGALLGLAVAAGFAGLATAWWQTRSGARQPAEAGPIPGFWDMEWEAPQGGRVRMSAFQARPLLINFWATWCPPCIAELPLINDFYRQNLPKGMQVLGLAMDRIGPVQSFLKQHPVDFPVALAGANGAEMVRSLGNLSGGLPFSVLLGSDGAIAGRKLGQLLQSDLDTWGQLK